MFNLRSYRKKIREDRFWYFEAGFLDTDVWIGIDPLSYDLYLPEAVLGKIIETRKLFDEHISENPVFLSSLSALEFLNECNDKFRILYEHSKKTGVGPMAGIAGYFAKIIGNFLESGYSVKEFIIENGGDIYLKTNKPVNVIIETGGACFGSDLALSLEPYLTPCGICTSSGKTGHSLNFGWADSFTVVCRDPVLADMYATALSNEVKTFEGLEKAIALAERDEEILCAVGVFEDKLCIKSFEGIDLSLSGASTR